MTRHDWVFEVLTDLASYAEANGLPGLAKKEAEALDVARREIAATVDGGVDGETGGGGTSLH